MAAATEDAACCPPLQPAVLSPAPRCLVLPALHLLFRRLIKSYFRAGAHRVLPDELSGQTDWIIEMDTVKR